MKPLVAIVGRPNVGKSTLFNRLVGRRSALVADDPGLTRDRHYGTAEWESRVFDLVDTGGFDSDAAAGDIAQLIRVQTETAIDEADVVLLTWDARDGLTAVDRDLWALLRRSGKPVLHVANKVDGPRQQQLVGEFYQLGVPEVFAVSAEHGLGMDALIDALLARLPAPAEAGAPLPDGGPEGAARIALVGRPNAGKSALLNRLAGAERSIVSEVPGTTRDPVDVELEQGGRRFVVVDTAGIRRKRRGGPTMEQIAVLRALRAIEEADVACLLLDGAQPVAAQDAKIANQALERGRGLLVAVNKCDLLGGTGQPTRAAVEEQLRDKLHFVDFAPRLWISALTGKGVRRLLPALREVADARERRITTARLNRLLEELVAAHGPPAHHGRPVRFYYITQPQVRPPTFVISTNYPKGVPASYRRYLHNRLREVLGGFEGVPLRLFFRARGGGDERRRKGRKGR